MYSVEAIIERFPLFFYGRQDRAQAAHDAYHEHGYSAMYPVVQWLARKRITTRNMSQTKKRAVEAANDSDKQEPKKRLTSNQATWLNSDRHKEGQAKGRQKRHAEMIAKFDALMATYQVRRALEERHNENREAKFSTALVRIDDLRHLRETLHLCEDGRTKPNSARFSIRLALFAAFYHPEKYPRGLRYLPEHGTEVVPDDRDHPAVKITANSGIRSEAERKQIAGPVAT